jgi:hypothetical protein
MCIVCACDDRISRPHHNETLTVSRDRPTIVARADVPELVSNRDKIREALTLVSFRD